MENQLETAKTEVLKPFVQEAELAEKLERLAELNALLNMDEKGDNIVDLDEDAQEQEQVQEWNKEQERFDGRTAYADDGFATAKASEPKAAYGTRKAETSGQARGTQSFHEKLEEKKEQAAQSTVLKLQTAKHKDNSL